jgi:NAD(P)-dependent dehydrogenase (short-subunit alcohol dehydrogenase family)
VERSMDSWDDASEHFMRSMHVNSTGMFIMTRAAGEVMEKQGMGSIINIGSIQGMVGVDGTLYEGLSWNSFLPDYFFHKGGMLNFTRFVASYYGSKNIRCNCVSPGGLYTEGTDEVFVQRYSDRTMLGRMANDTDLKGIIVFLASDASLYVTGANIPVDGGYTAK